MPAPAPHAGLQSQGKAGCFPAGSADPADFLREKAEALQLLEREGESELAGVLGVSTKKSSHGEKKSKPGGNPAMGINPNQRKMGTKNLNREKIGKNPNKEKIQRWGKKS